MSAATRTEIATAASTVEGVTCEPYHRQSTGVGDASVRLGETAYPNRFGGVVTWEVVVNLPQGVTDAERLIDEISPALRDALASVMTVRRIYPARIAYGAAQTNALVVEGTREEDEEQD